MAIAIEGTLRSIRALGKIAGIVFMIDAAIAQRLLSSRTVQGNTRMTVGFKCLSAKRTGGRLRIYELMAMRTIQHGIGALNLGLYPV